MRIYLLAAYLVCTVSCTLERVALQSIVLGHAGTGTDLVNQMFPPNSLEAMDWAIRHYNLDGVEADLQFTKDGVGVLYHDKYLEEETDKSGQIHLKSWAEIQSAVYRGRFTTINKASLMSLDQMLNLLAEFPNKYLSLDVKSFDPEMNKTQIAETLDSILSSKNVANRVFIETTDIELLKAVKAKNSLLVCLWNTSFTDQLISELLKFQLNGIIVHHQGIEMNEANRLLTESLILATYGQLTLKDLKSEISQISSIIQIENPALVERN